MTTSPSGRLTWARDKKYHLDGLPFRISEVETMDVSEYRKQYAERLERAAEEQREGYRAFSDKSKPVDERLRGLKSAAALTDEDEVAEAIDVIRDREEDAELRAATLLSITIAVGQNPDSMDLA